MPRLQSCANHQLFNAYECPPTTMRIILRLSTTNRQICQRKNFLKNRVAGPGTVAKLTSEYGTNFSAFIVIRVLGNRYLLLVLEP